MVEELKLAIKIDDASIEQSLLKQFANAQKMADKVVLDFKNVNFDDKKIEAKFKEMQKKAGQNPIDLTIGGNTFDMLGQIDKRLTEIFSIGKGKSFINPSSTVADIGKIENKINELNKRYEEMQKKLSSVGSEGISDKGVNLVDNAEFQKLSQEVQNTKSELSDLKDVISNLTSDNEGLGNFADQLDDRLRGLDNTVLDLTKRLQTLYSVMEQSPESNISYGTKDAFPSTEATASVEKVADGFKEVKQETEKATESAKEYSKILSQVGDYGVDKKVSAIYKRNDGQLESVNWRAKTDDEGNALYDKNGNIDYEEPNITVISKYEQLEKIIVKADDELRNLQKDLAETKNYDPNASTTNIEEKIADQKAYIQLLEQTVKVISQSDEYLMMEQQIIDARNKAAREYQLTMGAKQEKSDAKKTASEEQKRQKSIDQTNRLLNKQQIIIDGIEKSYSKAANNDLDKAVNSQSDLTELANKKAEIQTLLNKLSGQDRNSSNEKEFLQVEKLVAEYKQLAKDKLKANNPSKQELGGQELDVLLANQVTQYNKLISQSEKYGDATKEITNELKVQRDLIAEQDKNGVYVARSKKDDGSEITANDYYNARDNYKINKSIFNSYEDNIKNGTQSTAKQQAKSIKEEWTNAIKTVKEYESAVSKLNNLKASDKGLGTKTADIEAQQKKIDDMRSSFESAQATILSFFSSIDKFNSLPVSSIKEVQDAIKLIQTAANGSSESVSRLEDALRNMQKTSIDKLENKLSNYQKKTSEYSATINKFGDDGWTSPEYLEKVQKAREALRLYKEAIDELKANPDLINKESLANVERLGKDFEDVAFDIKNMTAAQKGYTQLGAEKALDKISQMVKENSKMSRQAKADIKAWYDQIASGNPSASLDVILGKVEEIVRKEKEAGRGGKSMWDKIADKVVFGYAAQLASYFLSFSDFIRYGQQAISIVVDLNTQITELAKVSEQTSSQIYSDFSSYADIAKDVGGTISDTISATSDWARNGYGIPDSKELARVALLYKNVGDGINIDEANESLISTLRGFKLEADQAEHIIDVFNEVSNNESISSAGIGNALQRSAASFNAANTSLEKSVALVTATNSVLQDPEKVGNMWKTVSARIRGADTELQEMGEDTEGMVESTSKLQSLIKGMTGFDIMESDGKTFKDIYDIIIGIGEKWNDLNDIDRASLLEKLAGKNQSNALAAALSNIDILKKAYGEASDAQGSAAREQTEYQKSIQYSIDQTKAALEELSQDLISSDLVKGTVNFGGGFITFLDEAISRTNDLKLTLPILLGLISSFSISKLSGGALD